MRREIFSTVERMDLCSRLQSLVVPTVKLLLYTGHLDIDDYLQACLLTRLPEERVVATRCGDISGAVAYLLDPTKPIETREFRPGRAYQIELQGVDSAGRFTSLSHAFILLNDGINWILIDSYIGCREFTCRFVFLDRVVSLIQKLEESFDSSIWLELTGCPEQRSGRLQVLIHEFNYQTTGIEERFKSLVGRAKDRLDRGEIGLSDEYLLLLDPNLDVEAAGEYLDSLL